MSRFLRNTRLPLLALVAGFLSVHWALGEDSGAWTLVDPWLRPRGDLAMAYDTRRSVTVMFGGFHEDDDVYLGDTWEYNGQRWTRKSTNGPAPRSRHRLAYDSRRGVVVLFGGRDAERRYGDTWEWDGVRWTLRSTEGPSPRWWPALAYDEHRGMVVLHGGYDGEYQNDTWEWDGAAWIRRKLDSPPSLTTPSMAYDSARRVMVLFGLSGREQTWEFDGGAWVKRHEEIGITTAASLAYDSLRGVTIRYGDYWGGDTTWKWDGKSWIVASRDGVGDIYAQGMVFDFNRDVILLFGGFLSGSSVAGDTTWEWDGQTWVHRTTGPLGRPDAEMVYDAAREHTVLFGGFHHPPSKEDGQTFAWDGSQWSLLATDGPGRNLSYFAMAYNNRSNTTLLFPGEDDVSTWEWDGAEWTWLTDFGPSSRILHAMSYDQARDAVVLFGGYARREDGEFGLSDETWEWDGGAWSLASSRGPSKRFKHAMAYDTAREVTMLFGGVSRSTANGETWEWDGRGWTLVSDTGPEPRYDHTIVYDEARKLTVLYGGRAGDELFSDLWEWDGIEWRQRQVDGIQPSRFEHAMSYDSGRQRVVLFGGWGEHNERLGDTWEFDPCVGLEKLKARCKADGGGGGVIKATVGTSLPEGSTVPIDNTDVANNTTDRQRATVNARGKAKHKWPEQHGEHAITLADCPRMTQTVVCDP